MPETIPNTRRFFVSPDAFAGEIVTVEDDALAKQLSRVLRLRPGDHVLLLNGLGDAYEVELTALERDRVAGQVIRRCAAGGEPTIAITLYIAVTRGERFEWVLQKGTELGVQRFVPVQFSRSLPTDRVDERKHTRWQRIVREAAEQSCRGRVPGIAALQPYAAACAEAAQADVALLLWEGEAAGLRAVLESQQIQPTAFSVLSGPEGGITTAELTTAQECGIIPASLGPRILRAETAPIAAAAALCYQFDT